MTFATKAPRTGNIVTAVLLLIVGVVVFTQMAGLDAQGDASDPGAAGYPSLLAGLLIILAIMLPFQADTGDPMPPLDSGLRVLGVVALLIAHYFLLGLIGYILATSLLLFGAMLLMGIRRILPLVLLPIVFSVSMFYLFYTVFGVALPRAFLEGFFS